MAVVNEKIQIKDVLRNKAVFENLPLAIFYKDRDGKYLGANSKFLRAISFETEEELIGLDDFDFISRDDAEYFQEADSIVFTGATYEVRTPIHEMQHKHYHVSTTKVPLYEGNLVVGLIGMFHDLKPQELQILDEYKTGEALLKDKIINGINSAVFIIDIESNEILRSNKIGDQILKNCDENDKYNLLYDKSWGAEDDSDISGVSDNDTITSNKQNVSYFESIDRYLTLSYKKIDWDDRQAYIRYINDVTELVNGEKNNQLTMKQLDKALAHANLIYFNYDIKSKLIHVNKAGKESLDLDFGEEFVTFEKTFEIFHPEFIDAYKESFYRILSGRNDYISFDSKIKFKTDGYSWREVKMSAIYDDESSRTKIIITCNDINRFKKLESRFITILDKNNITSWEYNIEKDEITMNKNLFNVITDYQVEPREFYRKKIHPDDLKIFDGIFEEIKNGAMQASGEYRSRPNKKSDWLWSHTEMTFLEKENKDMNIALGSSRDITKFKLAEKRYQDELSFQKIRNSSQLIYAIVNITKDNKILEFSSTDDRIASIDKSELIDRFYASIIDEKVSHDIQENYVKTLSSNFQKGISENQKTLRMNIFGKRLYIKLKFTIIQNPETNDLMAFVGGENVDLDVKNEQMLKLSSDQSYELFTRMDFTNDEMIAHRTDDSFYQFEGHTLVTSIEDSLMDLSIALNVPFQRAQNLEGVYNNMLEKKDSAITIFKLKNEKGEERIKRAKIIRIEGEPRVFAEFWDDITELTKENEDRNKELAEALEFAQSANIAKTTFLSAMSHDIRTPLNAIIGMNDLALDNIDDKQQVLQSLNIIKDSSRHLLSLINDILDMSRIESNKIVFNNLPYDAREVLNEIFDRMRALMNQKNQNLEVDLDIKNPFIIFDKVVFSKILENVINNSIKFSPERATIKVGVQDIESTDDSKYNQWKIIIEDNGIGMDEEGLENAFNPFYRASTSDVNNIEGTGLGLPIVKKNLAIMGGTINMESELSKGTKTIIEVPFKTQDCNKSKKEVVHKKHSETRYKKVLANHNGLLIEDNKVNMLLASKILDKFKLTYDMEYNGQDGLDKYLNSEPGTYDFILTDIQMPVMDGYDMVRAIRSSEKADSKSIPIIAMTANAFLEDIKRCMDCGMNAHIAKPIEVDDFKNKLYDILEDADKK